MNEIVKEMVNKFDVLKLTEGNPCLKYPIVHGPTKASLLYMIGSIGCLLIMSSILVLAIHSNEIEQSRNIPSDEVLNQINKWNFQGMRQTVVNSNYAITVTDQRGTPIETEVPMKLFTAGEDQNSITRSLGLVNEDSDSAIIVPSAYHQTSIDFLQTKHLKFKRTEELCLTLDIQKNERWYPIAGLINCGDQERNFLGGFLLRRSKQTKLTIAQMQLQGVCEAEKCQEMCIQHGGIFGSGSCEAKYYVQEACFVTEPTSSQRHFSITSGCYNGMIERLSLQDSQEVLVTVRDPADPYLSLIKFTQDGNHKPSLAQQPHVLLARKIFTYGALTFLICALLMVAFNMTNKPIVKEIELRDFSNRREQTQPIPEPVTRRSVALNYE